jgi:hypothetical protein
MVRGYYTPIFRANQNNFGDQSPGKELPHPEFSGIMTGVK